MSRRAAYVIVMLSILLAGCNNRSILAGFWDDAGLTVTEDNYYEVQDRFARFAELLTEAPAPEAAEALESLFDKLQGNEVDYIIYSEWMEYAFHNYYSPCRNIALFGTAVRRIESDGILSPEEVGHLRKLEALDRLNRAGDRCTLPEGAEAEGPALYLVLDLDCRTCREALAGLAGTHPEAEHIALCFGYSPIPDIPGWKYLRPEGLQDIFELEAAPFWFLTDADGTVLSTYSTEFKAPEFATPTL